MSTFLSISTLIIGVANMPAEHSESIDSEKHLPQKTVGLIVNPIAGMGGAVGLKGTDGQEILSKAMSLGAKPVAPSRAEIYLSELNRFNPNVRLVVGAGNMGEDEAKKCGLTPTVFGQRKRNTHSKDTREIAQIMTDGGIDILVFCGGDGTARDTLNVVDMGFPVLGVPTGVKMHSAVFAVTPQAAARVTVRFLNGELPLMEAEVMDVDEKAFREGHVSAKLYGYVLTPYEPHLIQANKLASPMTESELQNQAAIAIYIIEEMKPGVIYIVGPGTTTRTIADLLDAKKTLLGVDLFCNKTIIAHDRNEKQILKAIAGKNAQIIVTPIGGQGFVFGRGNQQLSPAVIRQVGLDNVIIAATKSKLRNLKNLRVDTGDAKLDSDIREHKLRVVSDYKIEHLAKIE
jgi:predicted polyphosphate/ATP-dependent NAD kinase